MGRNNLLIRLFFVSLQKDNIIYNYGTGKKISGRYTGLWEAAWWRMYLCGQDWFDLSDGAKILCIPESSQTVRQVVVVQYPEVRVMTDTSDFICWVSPISEVRVGLTEHLLPVYTKRSDMVNGGFIQDFCRADMVMQTPKAIYVFEQFLHRDTNRGRVENKRRIKTLIEFIDNPIRK